MTRSPATIHSLSTARQVRFPGLATLAAARGLTLAAVAARAGCSAGHLRAVQHYRRPCTDHFYRRLRTVLGCSAGDLQPHLRGDADPAAGPRAAPATERRPRPVNRRAALPLDA